MYIFLCITIASFNLVQSKICMETCLYALRVIMISILSVLCCHSYAGDRCVENQGSLDKNGGFYDLFTRLNVKL